MRVTSASTRHRGRALPVFLLVGCLLTGWSLTAAAQEDGSDPSQVRQRVRTEEQTQSADPQGETVRARLRHRLEHRIGQIPDLEPTERARMVDHLAACFRLGVPDDAIQAIFPADGTREHLSTQAMLQLQERVVALAQAGLPVEPVVAKVQEGLTKRVAEQVLARVTARMEEHVRQAGRVLDDLRADGADANGDPEQRRVRTREMAMYMWQGLGEGDCERLRQRLRDSHDTDDFVAAAGAVVRLREEGVEPRRALGAVDEALGQGYRAGELRQLHTLVAGAHRNGASLDEVLAEVEDGLGQGLGVGEMFRHMMQQGWMGPGDLHGPGGPHPGDPVGGGPGGASHGGDRDGQGGSGGNAGGGTTGGASGGGSG
jgi:hypothetical protein